MYSVDLFTYLTIVTRNRNKISELGKLRELTISSKNPFLQRSRRLSLSLSLSLPSFSFSLIFFLSLFFSFSLSSLRSHGSGANPRSASFNGDVLCRNLLSPGESNFKGQRPGVMKWNLRNRNAAMAAQSKSLLAGETIHSRSTRVSRHFINDREISMTYGIQCDSRARPRAIPADFRGNNGT